MTHTASIPWEQGSAYPWMPNAAAPGPSALPPAAVCYDSGRSALSALLHLGQTHTGWKRIWVPTYYCPDVVAHMQRTGIQVESYVDSPFHTAPEQPNTVRKGDVILIVNQFGMRAPAIYAGFYALDLPIIEDHTHDPWSDWAKQGTSTYSIASYRKTLPIPDGAAVWSPADAPLPHPPETESTGAALQLQGMLLKTAYLADGTPKKSAYLDLFRRAEMVFDTGPICTASPVARHLLNTFTWKAWRNTRHTNHAWLATRMIENPGWLTLQPPVQVGVPFAFIGTVPSRAIRDQVRQHLIEQSIYPAILWDLDLKTHSFTNAEAVHHAGRMLSIHCDGRYTEIDLARVGDALQAALEV